MLLKPNMVLSGEGLREAGERRRSGRHHDRMFSATVPAAVPGIVFLSGGQSAELASARLNAMHVRFKV